MLHVLAWIDRLLWAAGLMLGLGGLACIVRQFPHLPIATLKTTETNEGIITDAETVRLYNKVARRRKEKFKVLLILTGGGFAVLGIQALKSYFDWYHLQ